MKEIGGDRNKGRTSEKYEEETRTSLYGGFRKQRSRKAEK
jgi:hypothetical protein